MFYLPVHMNALERFRHRLAVLLDDRTHVGRVRATNLARHMGKTDAWLSNITGDKRGVRLKDLDRIADFFHVPPAELIRGADDMLIEATPSEIKLLRTFRQLDSEHQEAFLMMVGLRMKPAPSPFARFSKSDAKKQKS